MKILKQLKSVKYRALVIVSVLGLMLISSCEKVNEYPITYCVSSDTKTESLVIQKADWHQMDNHYEVCLPVKCYCKEVKYDYINVYLKPEFHGNSSAEWIMLPSEETSYRLEDYKIIIEKYDSITQNEYFFLVEMKVRS
ncbi:MAG: hypothetical protein KAG64_02815 [Bacteroidales bacterium]|nr:hypothetical protein [Bacteroidales bacterium]